MPVAKAGIRRSRCVPNAWGSWQPKTTSSFQIENGRQTFAHLKLLDIEEFILINFKLKTDG
jgi:hypothetical protein